MNIQPSSIGAAKRSNPSASQGAKLSAPQDIAGTKEKPGSKTKAAGNPGGGNGHGLRTGNSSRATRAKEATAEVPPAPMTRTQRRASVSFEAREKLTARRPTTLGQAARIPGISPSDIQSLVMEIAKLRR